MTKLNDTQLILLSTAAARENGSLIPLPPTIADAGAKAANAIAALLKRGLAEERETRDNTCVQRTDGDLRFGIFLTDAGAKAINIGEGGGTEGTHTQPLPHRCQKPPNLPASPPSFSETKAQRSPS
ncbi:hypothetical protein PIB19_00885 [Sphingomonas sp. 7/4-4]|uniref:hypothetical protein n=1 Tax=Sphingomonas sp. 7/4-4 TaxID=3018446 RepID=UPI0022F3E56C|nr:hypothetical protein [Sphingomonas sp. 7/4-4]WBY08143.1 hypothetical protein PIB19_00885 [Sphingomonas sp. 7/4-4]